VNLHAVETAVIIITTHALEEKHRNGDSSFKLELKKFYSKLSIKNSTSTRLAYEFLGESARLKIDSAYFAQRSGLE
jgi:hypothetical protein